MLAATPVIGIDPAPKKGLVIFDPESGWSHEGPKQARAAFRELREACGHDLVVGWDAPLWADFDNGADRYNVREVERTLGPTWTPGVSVRAFSGCPHWAISLDVTGYPCPTWLVRADADRLPLLVKLDRPAARGIVETHPALAMAVLWSSNPHRTAIFPAYKDNKRVVAREHLLRLDAFMAKNVDGWRRIDEPASA